MRLALVACLALMPVLSGCFLMPKQREGNKATVGPSLFDRETKTYFDRLTDDGTSARLTFKTKRPALCELTYHAQGGVPPTAQNPVKAACANTDGGRTEFVEKLTGLKTELLYVVVIRVWEPGTPKEKGEVVSVVEPSARGGSGDGGGVNPDGGKLTSLWIARFDMPLRSAEIHKHDLSQALTAEAVTNQLKLVSGCQEGVPYPKAFPFRDAARDVGITNLASVDYAAGTAKPHADAAGRLVFSYASLNSGMDQWTLLYKLEGRDFRIPIRPLGQIQGMEMESGDNIVTFDEPQLSEAVDPLKIDPSKPLKLKWTTSPLPEIAYVTFQIGRPNSDKAVYCVFPAEARAAEVDSRFLAGVEDGRHVVVANLVSHRIWLKYGWLATVYDWRSGRIEK